jgi:hypothetical protein
MQKCVKISLKKGFALRMNVIDVYSSLKIADIKHIYYISSWIINHVLKPHNICVTKIICLNFNWYFTWNLMKSNTFTYVILCDIKIAIKNN